MAVVNAKSQIITDMDAVPAVKTNRIETGGVKRWTFGSAEFASSDATSVARVVRLPSRAKVLRVMFACDDLNDGGTVDVGLHDISAVNAGAVVDVDFFASAVDTDTAALVPTNITYEAAAIAIENHGKRLWELIPSAPSADPQKFYDVTVTRNTEAATGTVALGISYVLDD